MVQRIIILHGMQGFKSHLFGIRRRSLINSLISACERRIRSLDTETSANWRRCARSAQLAVCMHAAYVLVLVQPQSEEFSFFLHKIGIYQGFGLYACLSVPGMLDLQPA
jgi:hypothetical protein